MRVMGQRLEQYAVSKETGIGADDTSSSRVPVTMRVIGERAHGPGVGATSRIEQGGLWSANGHGSCPLVALVRPNRSKTLRRRPFPVPPPVLFAPR